MQAPLTDALLPSPFRIHQVQQETQDTFTLELKPLAANHKVVFAPGQFNMIYLFGVGEVAISISGDPAVSDSLVHTTRAVGSVTKAMKRLTKGNMLGIRGPFGTAWPVDAAEGRDIVFVAGGIGLAPLRPAMYHVLANRERFGRVLLLYGTRTPQDILYKRELGKWKSKFDLEVLVTVDRSTGNWRGNVGVVTALIPRAPFDPRHTTALICGPEVMMHYTVQEFMKRGVHDEDIYVSMERNMKCAAGFCGHCQWGPKFVCKDGPVFRYHDVRDLMSYREF